MPHLPKLVFGGCGSAYFKFAIDLTGICIDNRNAKMFGNVKAESCLSDSGGARDDYQRLFQRITPRFEFSKNEQI